MDEEDIDIKDRDVLHYPRIRNILLNSSGLIFTPARAVKRVKIEQLPDDESQELEHQLDAIHQPGSSLQEPSHQDNLDSYNIQIKQEFGEYEYLSDCNDIDEADNFDQADNIDRSDNNIDPDNANSGLNDADNVKIKHEQDFDTTDHSDSDVSDNLDQVSNIKQVDSDSISSHTSDIEIISSDSEHQLPNKIILGSKKPTQKTEVGTEHNKANVLVDDYGESSLQNGCFCDTCEILFATPNALDAHKTSAHSFLVAVSRNVARKSTSKSHIRKTEVFKSAVAKISTGGKFNSRYCNHCHMTFSDHTSLKEHRNELLPIEQFNCNNCNLKFTTQNELTMHSIKHKELPNPKLVKVTKHQSVNNPVVDNTKLSKDLSVIYPKKDNRKISKNQSVNNPKVDKTKLSKDLSVIYPKKDKSKLSNANWLAVNKNDDKFKCTLCSEIFDNYNDCKKHRERIHPDTKNLTIFTKLRVKKRKDEVIDDKNVDNSVMIPKSTLFKCKNCNFHFLSGFTAVLHKACNIVKDFWLCGICNRKFRKEDQNLHKKQHEVNTRFRVHLIVSDLYHRILCRCSHCSLHFEEKQFKPHLKYCTKITKEMCSTCKILLPKSRLAEHTRKHVYFHFQPADFFILNYITEKHKRKSDDDSNETAPKIRKLNDEELRTNKVAIYYCKNCKCCVSSKRPIIRKLHAKKRCLKNSAKICGECGLYFTSKAIRSHSQYHSGRSITIRDIKMIDIVTMKVITPVIPNYPQCGKCKINFFSMEAKDDHICGEDYETCEFCGDKYHSSVYDIHRLFHDEYTTGANNVNPKTNNADSFTTEKTYPEVIRKSIMPGVMLRYESLRGTWVVLLFNCKICDINTETYDDCVEHSQRHIAQRLMREQSIKCNICHLKFDESIWSKHAEFHGHGNINRDYFKLLTFDPRNLLTKMWFQMFESLPENEVNKLINESVYGTERSVKMELVKPGRPEYTLYTCANCRICFEQNAISRHVADKCRVSANVCQVCEIAFDDILNLQQHKDLHEKGMDKSEFRIVSFNKRIEESAVNKTRQNNDKHKPYTVYKCANCDVCVTLRLSIMRHYCGRNTQKFKFCKICNQKFSYQSMPKHNRKHKTDPNFKAININIEIFHPRRHTPYPRKHTKLPHKMPIKVNKFNMQRPSKLMDHKVPVCRDLKGRIMLYKCSECQVCFMLHPSAENHRCDSVKTKFYCKICREKFGSNTIPIHKARHKLNPSCKADNFIINLFKPRTKTTAAIFTIKPQDIKSKEIKKVRIKTPLVKPLDYKTKLRFTLRNVKFFGLNEINQNKKKYIRYHCVRCNLTTLRASLRGHKCLETVDEKKYHCNICNQIIVNSRKAEHIKKHIDFPDFIPENIQIIKFEQGFEQDEIGDKDSPYEDEIDPQNEEEIDSHNEEEIDTHNEEEKVSDDHPKKYTVLKCVECNMSRDIKFYENNHRCVYDPRRKLHCKICDLIILKSNETKHLAKHNDPNFKKENIEIVPFKSNQSVSEKRNLEESNENDDDIVDKSVNVDFNQDYEETISDQHTTNPNINQYVQYECTLCKRNLLDKRNMINHHCTLKTKARNADFYCSLCKRFYPTQLKLNHKIRHGSEPNYHAKNIHVYPFYNKNDDDVDDNVESINGQEIEKIDNKKYKYIQYECTKCKGNLLQKGSTMDHNCTTKGRKNRYKTFFCDICERSYSLAHQSGHEMRHRSYPDYNSDTIQVVHFCNDSDDDELVDVAVDLASSIDGHETDHPTVDDQDVDLQASIVDKSMDVDFNPDYEEYMANQQKTNPNINQYKYVQYECTLCKRNLLDKRNVRNHNCSLKTKARNVDFECFKCERLYPTELKMHHKLRHDSEPDYYDENIHVYPFCNKNNDNESMDVDDTIVDKVESINGQEMENRDNKKYKYVQYECIRCKGNLLEKKSLIYHNCASKTMKNRYKTFFCDICKRSYSFVHQSAHEIRHRNYPDYNSDTIQVVPFCNDSDDDDDDDDDNDESNDDDSVDMVSSIDDQETEHLPVNNQEVDLQASIVSQENNIQASVDGQDIKNKGEKKLKYVQYECTICKVNLSRSDVIKDHNCTSMKLKNFYKTFYCDICKLFYSLKVKSRHRFRHTTRPDYNPDTIKVVPFCNNGTKDDDDTVDPSVDIDDQEIVTAKVIDKVETIDTNTKVEYIQYECIICKFNFIEKFDIKNHNCLYTRKNIPSFFCDICDRTYCSESESRSRSSKSLHELRHEKLKNYNADTIRSIPFDPREGSIHERINFKVNATFKIELDRIREVFGNMVSFQNWNKDIDVSEEKCSKCGLLFPTDILVNHLCKHHSKDSRIETVTKSDNSHEDEEEIQVAESNDTDIDVEQYDDSKEDFKPDEDVPNDLEVNENVRSTDEVKIEPRPSTSRTKPDLFKCSECNVYYLNANTCFKHVKYHEKLDPKLYIECKLCGLQFTYMTLIAHMKRHHETPFDVDKIVVEVYHPQEDGLPSKKELFCASERLQSLLVSSSNDEGCSSSTH